MGKHELDFAPNIAAPVPAEAPGRRHDHIWVLFLIAACALAEVFGSWLGIASVSGFPHYGHVTTGWVLFVTTEGFWGYALWSWLAGAPGPRSRRFAMTSAIVMFVLSFAGQEAGHLVAAGARTAPWYVVAIVTPLPLIAVGLIAFLVHLRQADWEVAMAAWREARAVAEADRIARAEADERASLLRELEALSAQRDADVSDFRARLGEAASALETAQQETAQALRRAEALERKLAAGDKPKPRKPAVKNSAGSVPESAGGDDLTMELLAYMALREDAGLRRPRMGGKLAVKVGCSPASARRYRDKFLNPDGSLREPPSESLTGPLAGPLAEGTT